MSKPVCKGCPNRTIEPNCHDHCERYLEQVRMKRDIKKKLDDEYVVETSRAIRKRMSR